MGPVDFGIAPRDQKGPHARAAKTKKTFFGRPRHIWHVKIQAENACILNIRLAKCDIFVEMISIF